METFITFVVVFFVLLLLVGGMAIGVIMGRKPISGSCGGMSAIGMEGSCDICGGSYEKCENKDKDLENSAEPVEKSNASPEDLATDAMKSVKNQ